MATGATTQRRRRPIQRRSRLTVELILEAAAQIFEERGYARGTTNHIAERAGFSVGTLYQYFPNKDALLVALTEQHLAEATAFLQAELALDPSGLPPLDDLLRRIVGATVRLHARRPRLHQVLFEEAPRPPELREAWRRVEREMTDTLEALLRAWPGIDLPEPRLAAWIVVQTVESLCHHLVLHRDEPVCEELFVDEVALLLRGYLVRRQVRGPVRPAGS